MNLFGFGIPFLLLLVIVVPLTVLCVVKSIVSKKNLYGIAAGIFALSLSTMQFPRYLSDFINGHIEYWEFSTVLFFLWYLVFCPMLAIFLFSRANKGVLSFPLIYWLSINLINFLEYIKYYESSDFLIEFLWSAGIIFTIVVIFARKTLKNIFFVPGAILLLGEMIAYMTYSYNFNTENIIYDITYISMIVLICKYVVTESEEFPKASIPQPVYAQPVNDYSYQYNNVNNNQPINIINRNSEIELPAKSNNTLADELMEYRNLYEQGLISEEDYNEKKKQILGI